MARPLRIQYPDAIYHVTVRGNERREIFRDARDRDSFLELLRQSASIYQVRIFSYVLMENHFHLLLQTPLANLGEFMRHFNIGYTGYYNRRHHRAGHLYQGRYGSILVERGAYLSVLSRYIHLNPVRTQSMAAKPLPTRKKRLESYLWSSLPGYLNPRKRAGFVDYGIVLEDYGGDNTRGRRAYARAMEGDLAHGLKIKEQVIAQSLLGTDPFIAWVQETFLKGRRDRECPPLHQIQRYRAQEEILRTLEKETGKTRDEIRANRGSLRQMAMDLLYRIGGMKGTQIGQIMGVHYSTVSQGRKRLQEKIKRDPKLRKMMNRLEKDLVE